MITRDGFAKILDFGLVKLVETEVPLHNPENATAVKNPVSRSGMILGTVAYMSPEQARGAEVDHRSDIFSFGSILYEACTGQRAWNGGSVVETLYKIIHAPAAGLGRVPAELQGIVRRCLSKVPDEREELLIAEGESTSSDTYALYLKGRYWWNKRSPSAARKAVTYFQQAIDTDPGYARAWAGMADCYNILGAHGAMEPKEAFARTKAAARQALTIDPSAAEAYASLGDANIHYDWNWKEAEQNLLRAIELSPNYGAAHHWYS